MTDDVLEVTRKRASSFEDMEIYQRAFNLSIEVHKISLTFPKIEQYALASQIRRASKSICANIAEGYGKQKIFPAEFRRFLAMALGSGDEMQVWARYCEVLGYIDNTTATYWRNEYKRISRMLQALLNQLR